MSILALVFLAFALLLPQRAMLEVSDMVKRLPSMPGTQVGQLSPHWIGPFAFEILASGPGNGRPAAVFCWLDKDRNIVRIQRDESFSIDGFVLQHSPETFKVRSVNDTTEFIVLRKYRERDAIQGNESGRVLVYPYSPTDWQVAIEVYFRGELVSKIGPLPRHRLGRSSINKDGSFAVLTMSPDSSHAIATVTKANGAISFVADLEGDVDDVQPLPDGSGILVRHNFHGSREDLWYSYSIYFLGGKRLTFDLRPTEQILQWLPDDGKALGIYSIGHEHWLRRYDFEADSIIWEIDDPFTDYPGGHSNILVGSYWVLVGMVQRTIGRYEGTVRSVKVIDTKSGKVVRDWVVPQPSRLRPDWIASWPPLQWDSGHFVEMDGTIYLIADNSVSVFELDSVVDTLKL
jgi:hypothetical protein